MLHSVLLQAGGKGGFDPMSFLLLGGIFIVMYFFLIRPQQKKGKEQAKFQEEIGVGTKVVTSSGIHGKIVKVDEKSVLLEIDTNTKIRVEKAFISMELTNNLNAPAKEDSKK